MSIAICVRYLGSIVLLLILSACAFASPIPEPASPTSVATEAIPTLLSPSVTLMPTPSARVSTSVPVETAMSLPAPTPTASAALSPTEENMSEEKSTLTQQLIQAAELGNLAVVLQSIQAGADINGRDAQGRTAAMAATHNNQIDTLRALIQAGADINIRDNRSDNPFLYASAEGLFEIVQLTIEAKADTKLTNRFGGTALIPACERGHVEIVETLLTRTDVDVNHVNRLGWTALLEAIVLSNGGERHQRIVQLLVDHGADMRIADKDGITPLEHANKRGYTEIVRILEATQQLRAERLIIAADQGDTEAVRQLLAQGADVHAQDSSGKTALIAAAYHNHLSITDLLIQAGADVNVQDSTKQSAYLISTSEGYLELLQSTLQAGADVHSKDSYNGTGLIRAAERGHVDIIQELLKTDIAIDHVNRLGWTAMLEAIIFGKGDQRHTEVVRQLIEAGANVNLPDGQGVTPLAHAQQRGYTQIVELLQSAGGQ